MENTEECKDSSFCSWNSETSMVWSCTALKYG